MAGPPGNLELNFEPSPTYEWWDFAASGWKAPKRSNGTKGRDC